MIGLILSILLAVSPFQIEEIEVTAEGGRMRDDMKIVAQISHSEIEALPVSNIADILAFLPNLDVRSRGAGSAQSDISLRGGTFDQVQILINGVPVQDVQTGHYALNIPISSALIERIEVLNTADNALCGAINIVTRTPQYDAYTLQMNAGTNGEVNPVFAGSWKRGEVLVNSSVEYARSEGYYSPDANTKEQEALRHTDYQLANVYLQTRWRGLDVQTGAQYKDAGLGTGYGYASTDQFDATRTVFASATYNDSIHPHWHLSARMAYRGQYDRYEWHRGTPMNTHWTHNTQAALYAVCHWLEGHKTTFGAEFKDEYIASSNMGEHNRWQASLHAGHSYQWRGLEASLNIAGHYNSWCGWYGSGIAEIGYKRSRSGVALTATRSLRMPTWTDLYYKAGVQRGDSTLKAEKAWTLALNGHYTWLWQEAGRLQIAGDIYYRWGEDIIDWNYNETDSLFHVTNHNRVNTFGLELSAEYHLNAWLRTVALRYAYTNLSLDQTNTQSHYLDHLRHKIVLHIDHGIYVWAKGRLGANWSLRWQDRAGTYVDIYGKAGNEFQPVLLLDGAIYVEHARMRISMECNNMTNRHYYEYGGVLMPGVQGRVRISAKIF